MSSSSPFQSHRKSVKTYFSISSEEVVFYIYYYFYKFAHSLIHRLRQFLSSAKKKLQKCQRVSKIHLKLDKLLFVFPDPIMNVCLNKSQCSCYLHPSGNAGIHLFTFNEWHSLFTPRLFKFVENTLTWNKEKIVNIFFWNSNTMKNICSYNKK